MASHFPTGEGSHQDPANLDAKFEEWRQQTAAETRHWTPLEPVRWASEHNVSFTKLDDKSLLAHGDNPEVDTYEVTYKTPAGKITGIRLEAMTDVSLPLHGPGRGYLKDDGTFFLSEFGVTAHEPASDGKGMERPLKLVHPTASIHQEVIAKALDGDKLTGWHIRGGPSRRQCAVFEFAKPLAVAEGEELTVKLMQNFAHQQTLGRFRMWVTTDAAPLAATDIPLDVEDLLLKEPADWSAADTDKVKAYYLSVAPELKKEQKQIGELEKRVPAQPTTLILKHRDALRVTHQHIRGDFARPGPEVTADIPHFLPPLPADASA